jgi:hypothetical protein
VGFWPMKTGRLMGIRRSNSGNRDQDRTTGEQSTGDLAPAALRDIRTVQV